MASTATVYDVTVESSAAEKGKVADAKMFDRLQGFNCSTITPLLI